jgi:hypothetical protein
VIAAAKPTELTIILLNGLIDDSSRFSSRAIRSSCCALYPSPDGDGRALDISLQNWLTVYANFCHGSLGLGSYTPFATMRRGADASAGGLPFNLHRYFNITMQHP